MVINAHRISWDRSHRQSSSSSGLDGVRIMQWNFRKSFCKVDVSVQQIRSGTADVLLIQDPHVRLRNSSAGNTDLQIFRPATSPEEVDVLIVCGMGVLLNYLSSTFGRVVGISLLLAHRPIWLISTYIQHSNALGLSDLCTHLRNWKNTLVSTPMIVGGDFNACSCLWGPPTSRTRGPHVKCSSL